MFTLSEIQKATDGVWLQNPMPRQRVRGVSIDSRSIKRGQLFIAIQGPRFDGHRFVGEAVRKGAPAVMVAQKDNYPKAVPVICVNDTTEALGHLAAFHRHRFRIPVIAVTGSAGKTTTKEMIAAVLKTRFNVLKNVKTENNQYGVPLTLLKLKRAHEIVVLELGTNRAGDIRWLAKVAHPTVAVFTNIGEAHLEGLKSAHGVFREKTEMIKNMAPHGQVILNKDDRYLRTISPKKITQNIIGYAVEPCWRNDKALRKSSSGVTYVAGQVTLKGHRGIQFLLRGRKFWLKTPAEGNIYNALAAISCGRLHKIGYKDIHRALAHFHFPEGRQEIKKIGSLLCIDDTYNANPLSFRSAIRTLDSLHTKGRRIVICGDMLELGRRSQLLHRSIGKLLADTKVDLVISVGPAAKIITQTLQGLKKRVKTFHCGNVNALHQRLKQVSQPGDIVLVKGSRRMGLERTIQFLTEELKSMDIRRN